LITKIPGRLFYLLLLISAPFLGLGQISKPQWVDGIGGPGSNSIPSGVKADKQNNIYVTGLFSGTVDFDPSPGGVYNLTSVGGSFDTYIAKYTSAGALIWAVSVGGEGTDQVNSLTIDNNGNPTVCGQYDSSSMDADPGPGVSMLNNNGDKDAFIIRLTTNGKFSWAHSIGSFQTDYGGKVVADSQGSVVAVSQYQGTIDVGGQSFSSQGAFNGLAVKYDVNGNFVWAINIADSDNSETHNCAIDANNNVILSGVFNGNDNFNPLGTATFFNGNGTSTFLAKYTPAGKLIWVNGIQGRVVNNNTNVCVNSKNDIYIDGPFSSSLIFNGTKTLNPQGQQDIFIAKYKSDGTFQVANDIGAPGGSIYNYGIVASKDDEIYVSGYFSGSIDFDPSATDALIQFHGQRDLFLSKFDENVNYKWAFSAGSANCNNSLARNVDIDQNNAVLLVGSFCSTVDFDATTCSDYPLTAQSDVRDSFIAKYIQSVAAPALQITSFSVPNQSVPAVIDQTKLKITITVPQGTNVTALVPAIGVSTGITISPASGIAQDFTTPVTYQLSNGNCKSLNYVVEVVFASITPPVIPPSSPTVCATSGADGTTNINGSINTYFPPINNVTLAAGSKTINLTKVPAVDAYGNNFGTVPIKSGDLLLIIQTQDATINYENSTTYGSGKPTAGADNLGGTGFTALGNSGKFEYVMATSNVPLTGGTLTFSGSGTGGGTVYTYTNASSTSARGKRCFQVIRVPQYANLKLTSNISPPPFNGNAGGIIAFQVSGNMDFNGFTVDVSERGFRGGYSLVKNAAANISDLYVTYATDDRASGKGEGIAGTPRYMWDGFNQVDNVEEGLPGGSAGKGAPANAGGGGNDTNAGGGGGGNGGSGGVGAWGYEPFGGSQPSGGRPGSQSYVNSTPDDATRLIMGGGGGGGHANDALTGVKGGVGGGIVIVSARTISGNGTILANGANGAPGVYGSHPDGSGGGGAGGSVFLKVSNASATANITVQAKGGRGGNTEGDSPATTGVQPHGPGGGGGGGIIFYNLPSGAFHSDVSGGLPGKTDSGNGITHNSGGGVTGNVISINTAALPPYLQSGTSVCFPLLTTTMSILNPAIPKTVGGTATYTIKITNDPSAGSAAGVEADCILPSGFTFQSATATYQNAATGATTLINTGTDVRPLMGDFVIPAGGSVTINLIVKIGCVASGTYNSNAQALYLDPTRDYTAPNRRITAKANAFTGSNTTYQTTSYGTVGGANYNGSKSTNEDAVVVNNAISNNTITAATPNVFCVTGNPGVISGSTPVSSSPFAYQWQSSVNNTTFTDIAGATAKDYAPATLNVTTYYRRAVISASCATPALSNVVAITIQPALSNNKITAPATSVFCAAGNPLAIIGNVPSGGDGTYIYTWQSSADNVNFFTIAGATARDYDPGVVNVTTYYRRMAASALCTVPLASNVITISVQPVITNNAITAPVAANFCATGNAAAIIGSTPSGGTGVFTYQWQSSTNNTTFTDIAGATLKDYDPPAVSVNTYFRRAVVSGACTLPVLSNAVTIKVEPALAANSITAPAANTFCAATDPGAITGSTPTGGNGIYSYQWQISTDNVNFSNIAGAASKNYDPTVVSVTTYFRRSVTSDVCTVPLISNTISIKIVVPVAITNNVITAPVITTFCTSGNPAVITGNTPSGGIGTFTYQWQSSANNIVFTNIPAATSLDLDPGIITVDTYYRRVAISGNCVAPVNSNVISMKVLPSTANNAITAPVTTTFCVTGDPAIIIGSTPTGGSGAYAYQWQNSPDNTTFANIEGATAKDYDPSAINGTTYYRRMVTSGPCTTPLVSNAVKITIQAAITNNNIITPIVASFCMNGNPAIITGNVPSGGNGTYSYQWQTSADNITFGNISGATAKDYDPLVVSTDTYYRRLVTSGTCTVPMPGNVVSIKILSIPVIPVLVDAAPSVCLGSGATLKISSPQAGITYNWYNSPAKTVILFSGTSYPTGNLSSAKTYYIEASNGTCGSALATATVSIASPPTAPVLAANPVAVCSGAAATLSIASPQNGFSYNWYNTATGGTSLHAGTSFVTPVITTATTYYAEATNAGGCISAARTPVDITVNPLPQLSVQDAAVCPGSSASLTAVIADFTGQIGWYADPTTTTALQLGTSKSFNTPVLTSAKSYYVEAISTGNCKTPVRVKVNVTMLQQLDAPVVAVDSTTNSTITFKWDAVAGAQGYQVSIDGGKTFINPSTGSAGLSHKVTGLQLSQQVTILVQALGASACQLSGSSTAVTGTAVSQLGNQIYVANAFTPNGDGNNDIVYVHSESIKSLSFYVYDQWGELLFATTDIKKGWDGYYKGTKEPTGVYVYFVKAIMNDGAQLNKKGTITLLR
jgi:gliding motility-associated-like protein